MIEQSPKILANEEKATTNIQRQRVPDRRTRVGESMVTFRHALVEWDFEEAGVSTGAMRQRRRVHTQKVSEIGVGGGCDGTTTQACNFMGNSSSGSKPVEVSEN